MRKAGGRREENTSIKGCIKLCRKEKKVSSEKNYVDLAIKHAYEESIKFYGNFIDDLQK